MNSQHIILQRVSEEDKIFQRTLFYLEDSTQTGILLAVCRTGYHSIGVPLETA